MKVTNEIKLLEVNGEDVAPVGDTRILMIESHWNYDDRVHLKFGELDILVIADDLERAIANARNHKR